ncbi:MAG: hypothetical protein F4X56_01170 [Gammaproteobacteria bacterium]|nr:hypothetical protein [Gammaproteobacteria bacterium]
MQRPTFKPLIYEGSRWTDPRTQLIYTAHSSYARYIELYIKVWDRINDSRKSVSFSCDWESLEGSKTELARVLLESCLNKLRFEDISTLASISAKVEPDFESHLSLSDSVYEENLASALSELGEIITEVDDEDTLPPASVMNEAKALVHRLYKSINVPMDVYATPEGAVILNACNSDHDMLFIQCNGDGSSYYMFKLDGIRTRKSYDRISALPDDTLISEFFPGFTSDH